MAQHGGAQALIVIRPRQMFTLIKRPPTRGNEERIIEKGKTKNLNLEAEQ